MLVRIVSTNLNGMVYNLITKNSRMMISTSMFVNSLEMTLEVSYLMTAELVIYNSTMPLSGLTANSTMASLPPLDIGDEVRRDLRHGRVVGGRTQFDEGHVIGACLHEITVDVRQVVIDQVVDGVLPGQDDYSRDDVLLHLGEQEGVDLREHHPS